MKHTRSRFCETLKSRYTTRNGGVLLEVILALTLFFFAAAIINSALRSSVRSVERLAMEATAEDLVVTVLSKLQMGTLPLKEKEPEPFEAPYSEWSWSLSVSTPIDPHLAGLRSVQIRVSRSEHSFERRLTQMWLAERETALLEQNENDRS